MKPIQIDRESSIPIYIQIRDALRAAVSAGALTPGDRLPPVTAFAEQLGVTQRTIRRALKDLSEEGLTHCHVGRGTFIADPREKPRKRPDKEATDRKTNWTSDPEFTAAAQKLRQGITKSLHALMPLAQRPGLIRLIAGAPDHALVDDGLLKELTTRILATDESHYYEYGDIQGSPALREALAQRYRDSGTKVTPDQILITNGSQQAISLVSQLNLTDKPRVLCETPCYQGATDAFSTLGHWVQSLPRDQEGPDPERLARFSTDRKTILYTCPLVHNPMGNHMTPKRRELVANWIAKTGGLLIADEILGDLQYTMPSAPSMLAHGDLRHTVVLGSLSKTFMGGMRIGWLVTDRDTICNIKALKRARDINSPPLMQGIALELIRSGTYDNHIQRARRHYQNRCQATLASLSAHMPSGVSWTEPVGGFHLWLELPPGYSSVVLFLAAVERGVAFMPGPIADPDHRYVNALRLSFGNLTPDQIDKGIQILAACITDLLDQPPSGPGLDGLGNFL